MATPEPDLVRDFVARCREIRDGSPNAFYAHVDTFCRTIERQPVPPAAPDRSEPRMKRPDGWLEGEIELTAFVLAHPDCDVRAVLTGFATLITTARTEERESELRSLRAALAQLQEAHESLVLKAATFETWMEIPDGGDWIDAVTNSIARARIKAQRSIQARAKAAEAALASQQQENERLRKELGARTQTGNSHDSLIASTNQPQVTE